MRTIFCALVIASAFSALPASGQPAAEVTLTRLRATPSLQALSALREKVPA